MPLDYFYLVSRLCAGKEHPIEISKQQVDYTSRNKEAGTFTRRIGPTTYRVGVHFSRTSRETAGDKIARLVRNSAGTGRG